MIKHTAFLIMLAGLLALGDLWIRPPKDQAKVAASNSSLIFDHFKSGDYVFIDARRRSAFLAGHIPGAFQLCPIEDFEKAFQEFRGIIPVESAIIVYCDDKDCPLGSDLSSRLKALGYSRVLDYNGGYKDWISNTRPTKKGNE